jgi:hypothetical protein
VGPEDRAKHIVFLWIFRSAFSHECDDFGPGIELLEEGFLELKLFERSLELSVAELGGEEIAISGS